MAVDNRGPQVSGIAGFFLAVSTIAIVLRCYCRSMVVKSFGIDDWSAIVAWFLFVFFCAFEMTGVFYGTGQHASAIPPADIPIGLKWWWACEPVYVLCNMALKFSIAIFLLRISIARVHTIIIWTTVAVMQVYSAFFFFLFIFQCRPSSYFWTRFTGASGTCIDPEITVIATYIYSGLSCATDWTLAIIPIFLVWDLQMNPRTKISVAMILALGAVASTATIIRIPYVKGLANEADFLYATTDVAIWSTVETGIGIAASSFATLRPLFRSFFQRSRLMGGTTSRSGTSPWHRSNTIGTGGYVRSGGGSKVTPDDFALRTDLKSNAGVTTVIASDGDLERQAEKVKRSKSSRGVNSPGGSGSWNNSESRLTEVENEEDEAFWGPGIRKTTISTRESKAI